MNSARPLAAAILFSFAALFPASLAQTPTPTPSPQAPEKITAGGRAEVLLNGIWQFSLAPDRDAANFPPPSDWGLIRVPGSWFPERRTFGGIVQKLDSWKLDDNANFAWYRRQIEIPASWNNKDILLEIDRVSTDAKVFLDGKPIGEINWPGGSVILTPHVRPGQKAHLDLFVSATTREIEFSFMGIGQDTARVARLQARGILGDVFLRALPKTPRINGVFIQTSVSKNEIALDVELEAPNSNLSSAKVSARATHIPSGETVDFPEKDVQLQKQGDFLVAKTSWPWENPKLWDYKTPNLYDLDVQITADGLSDTFRQRFGFREWKIEGRKAFLNGIEFRPQIANIGDSNFFPYGNIQAAQAEVQLLLNRHIGLAWMWPENYFMRGRPFWQKYLLQAADEFGLPMVGNLIRLNEYMRDANFRDIWSSKREAWQKAVTHVWRQYRNHPSVVGWILSGNVGPRYQDQNPLNIGRRGWNDQPELQGLRDAYTFLRQLDPSRFILFGAAAYEGDIYSAMTYLNFIPLQEREEWLSDWLQNGQMPYVAIEFGTPLNSSFMRGRKGFRPSGETEPLIAEFAAIYLGPEAYKLESQRYRRQVRSKYISGEKFQSFNFDEAAETDPAFQAIQDLFIRNTWRSWRAHNAGWVGMIAWHTPNFFRVNPRIPDVPIAQNFKPGMPGTFPETLRAAELATNWRSEAFIEQPAGRALLEASAPTLAWIAGSPDPTDKTHHYRDGQSVQKQIVLVNDSRQPLPFQLSWKTTGLPSNNSGQAQGTLNPAETKFIPISFPAANPTPNPANGKIELQATIGNSSLQDAFDLTVFSKTTPPPTPDPIAIWDPKGISTKALTSLGIRLIPWTGQSAKLLIVGREAFTSAPKPPADLQAYVQNGGRLLILTQQPDWFRNNIGLRIARQSLRHLWPIRTNHPVVQGLSIENLANWNANSTLLPPTIPTANDQFPVYGWRWGQRHAITAAAVEKPHHSGWTPILEGGFDLQYSPLLELTLGKGKVILCTLDLEDHIPADPAAEKLASNLIQYALTSPITPRSSKTIYIGNEAWEKFLRQIGLQFETATSLDPSANLAIIAPAADVPDSQIESFLQHGGKILFLASPKGGEPHFGANIQLKKNFSGSLNPPQTPESEGISSSDLRFKTDADARVLADTNPNLKVFADGLIGVRSVGKGTAVYCQLDPNALDADNKQYFRFTRWRQTRAISQLLSNLGATFITDTRIFNPFPEKIHLAGPWKVQFTKNLPLVTWENKHPDPGISPEAQNLVVENLDDSSWETFEIPANHPHFDQHCGEAVWRKVVEIPESWAGEIVNLHIPAIKSYDTVFWNGKPVGSTTVETQKEDPWNLPRKYRIPGHLVKAGKNTIAIRQFAPDKTAGIHGRADEFYLRLVSNKRPHSFYHPDYRESFDTGDEPARYYRW